MAAGEPSAPSPEGRERRTGGATRLRVVLCDDHRLFLDALGSAMAALGHDVVGLASTPGAALAVVARERPDCCLLDLSFPEGSGVEVIPLLRAAAPDTAVIVLSAVDDPRLAQKAVDLGAAGYLPKTGPLPAIAAALDAVARGEPVGIRSSPRWPAATGRPAGPLWKLRFLTEREWQVMDCILEGRTTDEIASALGVRRSTARTHVQNLLAKLGVHTRLQAAALMTSHAPADVRPVHLPPAALPHVTYDASGT